MAEYSNSRVALLLASAAVVTAGFRCPGADPTAVPPDGPPTIATTSAGGEGGSVGPSSGVTGVGGAGGTPVEPLSLCEAACELEGLCSTPTFDPTRCVDDCDDLLVGCGPEDREDLYDTCLGEYFEGSTYACDEDLWGCLDVAAPCVRDLQTRCEEACSAMNPDLNSAPQWQCPLPPIVEYTFANCEADCQEALAECQDPLMMLVLDQCTQEPSWCQARGCMDAVDCFQLTGGGSPSTWGYED